MVADNVSDNSEHGQPNPGVQDNVIVNKAGSIGAEKADGDAWVRRSNAPTKPAHPPLAAAILMIIVVVLLLAIGIVSAL